MKALVDARPAPVASFDIVVGHAVWQRASDWEQERAYIRSLAESLSFKMGMWLMPILF